VQDTFEKPLIASGCFSAYRAERVREAGGWSNRTMAEDMDLTWSLYRAGHKVRFVSDAVCYPIEPHDSTFSRNNCAAGRTALSKMSACIGATWCICLTCAPWS
jgi:GT2 family glycosyltransferase